MSPGRLLSDCEQYGAGRWDSIRLMDGSEIPDDAIGVEAECIACGVTGRIIEDPHAEGGRSFAPLTPPDGRLDADRPQ